ncbi:DUF4055 domain-containing protein [Tardiphaga sp. vice352]|uniref:DUF4055 domain-containing protein n=1 Tax=Tardiphaga sp. vice352 TaxID=2592816 RepID=UPI001164243E|nr:DUF4055 domain-containing protein [Tardiphaga sp. vice352]QDM32181.1 DUF4055 domain-containing protein [Tardiphaga sp. vice352]
MTNEVAKPTVDHDKGVQRNALCRTLMGGTRAMRSAGEQYLPKFASETAGAYASRVKRSVLFNAYKKTVADMTGKVFAKPIILGTDVPAALQDFAENIDLTGRNLNVFARDAFFDALQPGIGFVLVDAPPAVTRTDGLTPTLADYQKSGWRPYMTYVPIENLIGWQSQQIDGIETLTQVRILESVTVAEGDYAEKCIDQIRVLRPGSWETWRKSQTAEGEWALFEEGSTSLAKIPLAPIYLNRTSFMCGAPPLEELADLNCCHWQSSSDQRNILTIARVPILFGTGFGDDAVLEIGASSLIRNSDPNAKLSYIEHSGQAIGAGDKDIENLERQMEAMGLQLLVDKPGGKTATGEIRDDAKENSQLASMAAALQDAIEHAFGFMAEFIGLGDDAGGSVVVNKEFGVSGGWGDIAQLLAARVAGEISRDTYWTEMQRRGFLADDFDPEVEASRLENEAPVGGPPMDLGHDHPHS